jgi:methionyl-tRNA formyltransferase
MRVIFFGTSAFAVPSLETLVTHGHAVVTCVTRPDRPRGRGLILEPSPVKQAALRLGVPLSQPERLRAALLELLHPDVGVAAAFGQLIRRDLLAVPLHGILGVHPSLLPAYRGAAPVAWAILNGETTTGVTIFRLSERLDAGDVISRTPVTIDPADTTEALTARLAACGAQQVLAALQDLASGRARFEPQDESQATFAPKLTKAQGAIDWRAPAEAVVRVIRATIPWPGATTELRGTPLKIWSASLGEAATPPGVVPGTILRVAAKGLTVSTGKGTVVIREVQPPGRRRMTIREFLAGHPIPAGEIAGRHA